MRGFFVGVNSVNSIMRITFAFLVPIIVLLGCGEEHPPQQSDTANEVSPDTISSDRVIGQSQPEFHPRFTEYKLTDTIIADLNGDGALDKLVSVTDGMIVLTDGATNETNTFTCVSEEGETISDFSWVTNWGVQADTTLPYTFAKGGELFDGVYQLENPAIVLWQDGGGSGFFTFKGGKFVWVTTGC
jgi:hypothetical protein